MLSLKTSNTGFGYKAEFVCSDALKSMVKEQGYSLWLSEELTVQRHVNSFHEKLTLRLADFDVENYGSAKVNAKVYLTLSNGLVVESAVVSYSMQDMVELVDTRLATLTAEQILALKTMLAKFTAPEGWNIPNLKEN